MPQRCVLAFGLVGLLAATSAPAWGQAPPPPDAPSGRVTAPDAAGSPATTPSVPANRILVGTSRQGLLTASDLMLPDGSYYDFYRFDAAQGTQYRITLSSADFDTFLKVTGPGKEGRRDRWIHDDIGPDRTDSDLVFTAPANGTYEIMVNAFAEGERGRYRLSITTTDGSFENAPREDEPTNPVAPGQLTT